MINLSLTYRASEGALLRCAGVGAIDICDHRELKCWTRNVRVGGGLQRKLYALRLDMHQPYHDQENPQQWCSPGSSHAMSLLCRTPACLCHASVPVYLPTMPHALPRRKSCDLPIPVHYNCSGVSITTVGVQILGKQPKLQASQAARRWLLPPFAPQ